MIVPSEVLEIVALEYMNRTSSTSLRYKGMNRTVKAAVDRLMAQGKVGYLYPDSSRSPK